MSKMSKEDWFGILAGLFLEHVGHDQVDEDAWMEDYTSGKDPVAAFYDEYPEYE